MLFLAIRLEETFQIQLSQLNDLRLATIGDVTDQIERLTSGSNAEP